MRRGLSYGLLLLWSTGLSAGEVLVAHAGHDHGLYSVEVDMRLNAPRAEVWQVLTDYSRLYRLNDAIVLSEVLEQRSKSNARVRIVTEACVYLFCMTVIQVQDVVAVEQQRLVATVLPALSHFRHGVARAELWEEGAVTRLRIVAEVEPNFWVPPLIGPWIIARKLRSEALETMGTLEQLCESPVAAVLPE